MSDSLWALFALTIAIASISPGPNVLIIITHSLKYGWRAARFTLVGNLACLFCIALLAAIGVGAVIKTTPVAYSVMKFAGGMYLVYLGINLIRSTFSKMDQISMDNEIDDAPIPKPLTLAGEAFLVTASNPKAIVFLSAVFPQFLNSNAPIAPQFAIMFATIIVVVTCIHGGYGLLASRFRTIMLRVRIRRLISRITGITFVGLGATLAFSK